MKSTSLTSRPALSTVVISASVQANGRLLDGLLTRKKEEQKPSTPSRLQGVSQWFSQTNYLGLDDNKERMYSLTRSESLLFATIGLTGLVLLGSLVTWLFN